MFKIGMKTSLICWMVSEEEGRRKKKRKKLLLPFTVNIVLAALANAIRQEKYMNYWNGKIIIAHRWYVIENSKESKDKLE